MRRSSPFCFFSLGGDAANQKTRKGLTHDNDYARFSETEISNAERRETCPRRRFVRGDRVGGFAG
jgi:hypothetical protein